MEDPVVFWIVLLVLALLGWRVALWRPRGLPGVTRSAPLLIGHRGLRPVVPHRSSRFAHGGPDADGPGRDSHGDESGSAVTDSVANSAVVSNSTGDDIPLENTVAAFRVALESGLDGVECDVQRTRDGKLVLYHDERLGNLVVTGSTLTELREIEPRIALLDELLELAKSYPGTLLNLEIKLYRLAGRGVERQVVERVRSHGLADRVLVSSFRPLSLARLRLLAPDIRTGLLFAPDLPGLLRSGRLAGWLHVDALHPRHDQVSSSLLEESRTRGLPVNAWTVNDGAEVMRLSELGVNGIIADDPEALKRAAGR